MQLPIVLGLKGYVFILVSYAEHLEKSPLAPTELKAPALPMVMFA